MLKKVDLNHQIWSTSDNVNVIQLIDDFVKNPSIESETFENIVDCIWDAGVCKPIFFAIIPYLIEVASKLEFKRSKDLWCYLGSWISVHKKYREGISAEVLELFDFALTYAEEQCINQIVLEGKLDNVDAQYLYASLFAFAKHRLGYMTMGSYKDDIGGTSITACKLGHLNTVTVYNSGIVPYENEEYPRSIALVDVRNLKLEKEEKNFWLCFNHHIQEKLNDSNLSKEIKSHLELSQLIIRYGVTPQLPIKYAFSLYGSLLYCNGSYEEGCRVLHGWDKITCRVCGEKFVFADGWCEDIW